MYFIIIIIFELLVDKNMHWFHLLEVWGVQIDQNKNKRCVNPVALKSATICCQELNNQGQV